MISGSSKKQVQAKNKMMNKAIKGDVHKGGDMKKIDETLPIIPPKPIDPIMEQWRKDIKDHVNSCDSCKVQAPCDWFIMACSLVRNYLKRQPHHF